MAANQVLSPYPPIPRLQVANKSVKGPPPLPKGAMRGWCTQNSEHPERQKKDFLSNYVFLGSGGNRGDTRGHFQHLRDVELYPVVREDLPAVRARLAVVVGVEVLDHAASQEVREVAAVLGATEGRVLGEKLD